MWGYHISISNLDETARISKDYPAIQFFACPPQRYITREQPDDVIEIYRNKIIRDRPAFYHAPYVYNFCGKITAKTEEERESSRQQTINGMRWHLKQAWRMGVQGVIVHTGAHKDPIRGAEIAADTINELTFSLEDKYGLNPPHIIMENTSGEKNRLGRDLHDFARIYDHVADPEYVKICIDTAHAFGSGLFDPGHIGSTAGFIEDFDKILGIDKLSVVHLNDSRLPFRSKKDRHELIGCGHIWHDRIDGLKDFCDSMRSLNVPMIGEPSTPDYRTFEQILNGEKLYMKCECKDEKSKKKHSLGAYAESGERYVYCPSSTSYTIE